MRDLYNIGIHVYIISIYLLSFFNKKASLWIKGRKDLFSNLKDKIKTHSNIVWIHCASFGEFEQGKPIIEAYKKNTQVIKYY